MRPRINQTQSPALKPPTWRCLQCGQDCVGLQCLSFALHVESRPLATVTALSTSLSPSDGIETAVWVASAIVPTVNKMQSERAAECQMKPCG